MRHLIATIAAAAAVLLAGPATAAENLNSDFEDLCKSFRELNTELGASASPGSPIAGTMQKELSLSAAQYGAQGSLEVTQNSVLAPVLASPAVPEAP